MWQLDTVQHSDFAILTECKQRRCIFARPIPSDDGRAWKIGYKERTCGVTKVMFKKMETKIAWPEMFFNESRIGEHSQITIANLFYPTVQTRSEHFPRNQP